MERMGDILARSARMRARRGRLSAAQAAAPVTSPAPTPAMPPTPALPERIAPATRPLSRAMPPPAARRITAAAPDVTQQGAAAADALDSERILELPARRTPAARSAVRVVQASAPATTPRAMAERPTTQRARATCPLPANASRMSAGSSGMISLGAAAQGYTDALRSMRSPESGAGEPGGAGHSAGHGAGHAAGHSAGHGAGHAADLSARRTHAAPRRPTPPDVCPHCQGAGYVRFDVPVGDPNFGQAVACSCKERLLEDRRMSDLRRMSSLDAVRDKTFDTFETSLPGVREALEVARRYADDPNGWLVLSGGYGVGKTHLAAAIAHQRLAHGQSVFFSIVPDLLDHLRAAFAPSSEMPYDELFDKVREAGVLVLDDLGAENATAWATEKLFQIINYRYNYRMPTVVTTNNRLLSHMDERIRSRLSDMSFVRNVVIDSADYRERHAGRPRQTGSAGRGQRGAYQR